MVSLSAQPAPLFQSFFRSEAARTLQSSSCLSHLYIKPDGDTRHINTASAVVQMKGIEKHELDVILDREDFSLSDTMDN
jgi:hypothetical protein